MPYCPQVTTVPHVRPVLVATGALYSHLTSYILTLPALKGVYNKYHQFGSDTESTLKSTESASAVSAISTSLITSVNQSWAVAELLELTGAKSYKAAAIVGILLFAIDTGSQLINAYFVDKKPLDVIATKAGVNLLQTVALSSVLVFSARVHKFNTEY